MRSFITALQFLTRLHFVDQHDLTAADFGRSTRWFTLVGAVLGICYGLTWTVMYFFFGLHASTHPVIAAVCLIVPILLTGAIHCDGFMDTMDGLFSGRERERKLEIMKDSRTGSFGVTAFVCIMLFNYAVFVSLPPFWQLQSLVVMPVIGRLAMVGAVSCFPYARPEGMGKIFSDMADTKTLVTALTVTVLWIAGWCLLQIPDGLQVMSIAAASLVFASVCGLLCAFLFARYACRQLGGLTGDVYGAVTMLSETAFCFFLLFFLVLLPAVLKIPGNLPG